MASIGDIFWRVGVDDAGFEGELVRKARKAGDSAGAAMSKSIGGALTKVGSEFSRAGHGLTTGLTLPILAVGGAASHMALDFDTALRKVVGLTDVTQAEIGGIREQILAMSHDVGKAPQELAEAFYFVASAGFKAEEAMRVLEVAAKTSGAGLGDTQTIAQVLGSVINAYGHENMTAAHAADILTESVSQGTAEASEFAGVIGRVVPIAASLGVSFDQVGAALAGMTLSGVDADEAATALRQIMVSLLKPTSEAEDALATMGTSSSELRAELREKGLLATLRDLEARFGGNADATAKVFGNVRALAGIQNLLGLSTEQLDAVFSKVSDSQGRYGEAFDNFAKGPGFRMNQALADLQVTGIQLGDDVLPAVVSILQELAGAARAFGKWWGGLSKETKQSIIQWAAWLAIAGPVLILVGKLATGLGAIFNLVGFLAGAKGIPRLVGALKTLKLASLGALGPIGLIVVAALALKEATKPVDDFFDSLIHGKEANETLKGLAELLGGDTLKAAGLRNVGVEVEEFARLVEQAGGDTDKAWRAIVDNTKNGVADVGAAYSDLGGKAHSLFGPGGITGLMEQGMADAKARAAAGAGDIPSEVSAALVDGQFVVSEGMDTGVVDPVADAMQQAIEDTAKAAEDLISALAGELAKGPDEIKDEMKALREALTDPYTDPERRKDIEAALSDPAILAALESGDSQLEAETAQNVEDMLADYELLAPGALAQGKLINPAFQKGLDTNIAGLMTYLRTKGYDITNKFDLARALESQGHTSMAGYIRGLAAQQKAAQDTAGGIALRTSKQLAFNAYAIGKAAAESYYAGLNDYNSYSRAVSLFGGKIANLQHMMAMGGSPDFYHSTRIGEGVGESWTKALLVALQAALPALARSVATVAQQMSIAPKPGLALAGAVASPTSPIFTGGTPILPTGVAQRERLGGTGGQTITNQTNIYNLHVTGNPTVDDARDALEELRRLQALSVRTA